VGLPEGVPDQNYNTSGAEVGVKFVADPVKKRDFRASPEFDTRKFTHIGDCCVGSHPGATSCNADSVARTDGPTGSPHLDVQ
jgi:hypothetical protein